MLLSSKLKPWSSLKILQNPAKCLFASPYSTPLLCCRQVKELLFKNFCVSSQSKFIDRLKPFISCVEHNHFLSTSHQYYRKKGNFKNYDPIDDDDDYEVENEDDEIFSDKKYTKVFQATSTRIDLLLKNAFGYARKTIDKAFYESRITLNGKKVIKKGEIMKLGDEADIVQGYSEGNSKFLIVSRIELKAVEVIDEDNPEQGLRIKLIRYKNIKVPNYNPPWKSSTPES